MLTKSLYNVIVPDYEYWRKNVKCRSACPVNTDSRGYARAIAGGDYEKAYWIARLPNPLASICGRVCGAPCELACRRKNIDESVSIRALKRFVTEMYGVESYSDEKDSANVYANILIGKMRSPESGLSGLVKKADTSGPPEAPVLPVSIIGAGPAGLACAHDLALMGYKPVIYEMEALPGGMCTFGIPPYRLPRSVIQAEIEAIKALGVEIRLGVQVGKDVRLKSLYDESSAVVMAVGAKKSRFLPIEGSGCKGILGGVDFLREVFTGKKVNIGAKVVVIGGGNVAYDVARTAVRQPGVEKVTLVCIEDPENMLADKVEVEDGTEEGIKKINSYGPDVINPDENGTVHSVTFKRVLSIFDYSGRFNPSFDESDKITIEADTVFFSVGQAFDLSFLENSGLDVETTDRGMIKVLEDKNSTTLAGLFVAGDLAYGPKLIIDAVANGRKAALRVHEHITKKRFRFDSIEKHTNTGKDSVHDRTDFERIGKSPVPALPPEIRVKELFSVVEKGFTENIANEQGQRCLNCAVNTIFDGNRCILCGGCVDVCPEYCLKLVSLDRIEADETLSKLYKARYGGDTSYGVCGAAIIKDEDRCIRCGLCVKKCPVNAITMELFTYKEVLRDE